MDGIYCSCALVWKSNPLVIELDEVKMNLSLLDKNRGVLFVVLLWNSINSLISCLDDQYPNIELISIKIEERNSCDQL